jgi:tripartite-type tricarboxylate transporter receptor subunit TctC
MARTGKFWMGMAAALMMSTLSAAASAQHKYPSQTIKVVVPLGPGSATDTLARLLSESLRTDLKAEVIVENKAGAGGVIGGGYVARAKPDGYTIGVFHSSVLTTAVATSPNVTYDPHKDFTPIGNAVNNPWVLGVAANSRFKTLEDLIAAAKKEPGKYNCGIIGVGSHSHFNLELLKQASGADLSRIPYSAGTGAIITGLLGGHIDSASMVWAGLSEHVRTGKIRILAASSPLKGFPDVPTFASKGYPQASLEVGFSVVGPAGMPKEVTDALVPAIKRAIADPKNVAIMEKMGFRVLYQPPQQLAETLAKELAVVSEVARKAGIKAE